MTVTLDRRAPQLRKLYYSIGEVSERFAVPPHVLRYWEQEFPQLRPKKAKSGNRLYQEKDLRTIERIKTLLYEKRFTIAGARSQLSLLSDALAVQSEAEIEAADQTTENETLLEEIKQGLREILHLMK
jgi:DNA-binding transcriptional MerR regulator